MVALIWIWVPIFATALIVAKMGKGLLVGLISLNHSSSGYLIHAASSHEWECKNSHHFSATTTSKS